MVLNSFESQQAVKITFKVFLIKNFAELDKFEADEENQDDFDWEDLSDRQVVNELALCIEHAYDILDPFSIFQSNLIFIITIRKVLSKLLPFITKSTFGKHC